MAAPKGNKFWEARSSHGANPKFEHASDLWDACLEYFEWIERNPLLEGKVVTAGGKAKVMSLPKMRAMTTTGQIWWTLPASAGFPILMGGLDQISS